MNFAIIAAGEGSRLASEGITTPKPLVTIMGISLIDRLIDIFVRNGASSISVIVNSENHPTISHLENNRLNIPFHLVVKTTPGSMYSLHELKPFLGNSDFCLTTVDTIFLETEFSQYINMFKTGETLDGLMAVTDFIDDEKPLYVDTDQDMQIAGFCDQRPPYGQYISGGIYCLRSAVWDVLEDTMQNGMTRMRDFQRNLISHGLNLKAYPFSKIIDIDHAADIRTAENFLMNTQ